ncbi:MAG: hypothetical protein CMN19_01310 [Roseovarius sp.]|nr:hypothetical protein [Roseovarius sp.]
MQIVGLVIFFFGTLYDDHIGSSAMGDKLIHLRLSSAVTEAPFMRDTFFGSGCGEFGSYIFTPCQLLI